MSVSDRGDRTLRLVEHAERHANLSPYGPFVDADLPMYGDKKTRVEPRGDFAQWLRGEAAEYLGFVPMVLEIKAVCDVLAYRARRRLHEDLSQAPEGA